MNIRPIRATRAISVLMALGIAVACTTPQSEGRPADPRALEQADRACYREAVARYGTPETQRDAGYGDRCDVQSWLCQKSQAWMLRPGNPLSSATPEERAIHRHVAQCLADKGYGG